MDVAGWHRADGTQHFAPRFFPGIYFFLRKGHSGSFPPGLSHHPTDSPVGHRMTTGSRWEDTRLCHTAPALAGSPPGPLDNFLAHGLSCLQAQAGWCVGFTLFMAWAVGSCTRHTHCTTTADVNAWGMFPNRAIIDLNDSIFQVLAARCFQKPHVLSLS